MLFFESSFDVDVLAQVLLHTHVEVCARVLGFRGDSVGARRFAQWSRIPVNVVGSDQHGLLVLLFDSYGACLVIEKDLV